MSTKTIKQAAPAPYYVYLPGTEAGYKNPANNLKAAQSIADQMKQYSGVTAVIETSDGEVIQGNPVIHTASPWRAVEFIRTQENGLLCNQAPEGHLQFSGNGVHENTFGIRCELSNRGQLFGSSEGGHVCDLPIAHDGRDQALANAQRIAAAVNATDGIPTEVLESGIVAEMVSELKALRMHYQRDNVHDRRYSNAAGHGVNVAVNYKTFERIDNLLRKISS